jgi:putative peptidoglycan lipid II flippase
VLCGAALGSFALPILAARAGGLHLKPILLHPGLKRFVLLALPLMLGQSIVVLDEQFVRIFGSLGPEGSISHLNYARRIMMVPVGVVAQAAGIASFPFLAALIADGNRQGFDQTVNKALLTSLAVIMPLSFWMMSVATPTIRLIFEQGAFSSQATAATSLLLVIMLCATAFWAVQQVLSRGFYANQNTMTPVLVGTASTLTILPFYWLLTKEYGAVGVAVAGVGGMGLYTVFMLWRWKAHFGIGALAGLGKRIGALLALSLPCALLSRIVSNGVDASLPDSPLLAAFFSICAAFVVFALCFTLLCRLLTPSVWADTIGVYSRREKNSL